LFAADCIFKNKKEYFYAEQKRILKSISGGGDYRRSGIRADGIYYRQRDRVRIGKSG
jgi:hypothetical protein